MLRANKMASNLGFSPKNNKSDGIGDRARYLKSREPAELVVIVSFSLAGDEVAWADRFLGGP